MAKCSKMMFLELNMIVVSLDSISGFLNEFVQYEIRSIYIYIYKFLPSSISMYIKYFTCHIGNVNEEMKFRCNHLKRT